MRTGIISVATLVLGLTAFGAVHALSATTATGAAEAPGGSISIVGGRGSVQITGNKALIGFIEKGSLKITDLTATDGSTTIRFGTRSLRSDWVKPVSNPCRAGRPWDSSCTTDRPLPPVAPEIGRSPHVR